MVLSTQNVLWCVGVIIYIIILCDIGLTHNILSECQGIIKPKSNDIIICDNNCDTCYIDCSLPDQCKESVYIFSGALNTRIKCLGYQSCLDIFIFIGNTGSYPPTYNENNFIRELYESFIIDCTGNAACVSSNIFVSGNFNSNGFILANGTNDNFKDARLSVNLFQTNTVSLYCSDNKKPCSGKTNYICYGGTCLCVGLGCHSIENGIDMRTPSPTKESKTPTIIPTHSPSKVPTKFVSVSPSITPTNVPTLSVGMNIGSNEENGDKQNIFNGIIVFMTVVIIGCTITLACVCCCIIIAKTTAMKKQINEYDTVVVNHKRGNGNTKPTNIQTRKTQKSVNKYPTKYIDKYTSKYIDKKQKNRNKNIHKITNKNKKQTPGNNIENNDNNELPDGMGYEGRNSNSTTTEEQHKIILTSDIVMKNTKSNKDPHIIRFDINKNNTSGTNLPSLPAVPERTLYDDDIARYAVHTIGSEYTSAQTKITSKSSTLVIHKASIDDNNLSTNHASLTAATSISTITQTTRDPLSDSLSNNNNNIGTVIESSNIQSSNTNNNISNKTVSINMNEIHRSTML